MTSSFLLLAGLGVLALTASAYTIVDLLRDGYRRRATLDGPEPDRTMPRSPERSPESLSDSAVGRPRFPARDKVARKTSTSSAAKAAARRTARASHHAMEGE
ncbi:hypothetical protein [Okibacterium fritillariae]|uniref:Uncharacterized protein n=1 Tax=Okibacterium fritillariae TaxID=123320 RepID=A0A1T5KH19_9MICO|nr:hypothetical protein [Okibacterium fritillariae]SKC63007.1 hypothetical protein SAMN06309945_2227 [Okibacterium fritillariae]